MSPAAPAPTPLNIDRLGQVFTPDDVVEVMLSLRQNQGRVLEPSCGNGAFVRKLPHCVAIEKDPQQAPKEALLLDFFAYPPHERFASIIGNPPYVRHQNIAAETLALIDSTLFDRRSNLYLFFIEKCVRHLAPGGELIFITPRDFLKSTSSVRLNAWLMQQGSITHAIDLGDTRIFEGAVPNCLIWRFEQGQQNRTMKFQSLSRREALTPQHLQAHWQTRACTEHHGQIIFTEANNTLLLSALLDVKVGAVSGLDALYANEALGNRDFVYSATVQSGRTRKMLWTAADQPPPAALIPHKTTLMQRKIRPFNEGNWWTWGRGYPETHAPRIYVNGRTRNAAPFFVHPCPHFDGSVLALFPKHPQADLPKLCAALNRLDWAERGFVCDGRFLFTQRSLAHAPLPESFRTFL